LCTVVATPDALVKIFRTVLSACNKLQHLPMTVPMHTFLAAVFSPSRRVPSYIFIGKLQGINEDDAFSPLHATPLCNLSNQTQLEIHKKLLE
jgi:hypothetical protein